MRNLMLAKYYRSRMLNTVILITTAFITITFFIWYENYSSSRAPHWVTVLALYALAALPIFLPTKRLALPDVLMPIIMILALNSVDTTLSALEHSLTFVHISWPLMAYTMIAVGLILRRHVFFGWFFFIGFMVLTLSWRSNYFDTRMTLSTEFGVPLLLLAISMIIPKQIEQAVAKTRQATGMRIMADAGRAEENDMSVVATQRVQEVRALTEDMLHRIAYNSSPVTPEEMDKFRFTEAQLRDTIRGRYIVNKEILDAAWLARQRGVKVDILDERGSALPSKVAIALTRSAVDLFENAFSGTVTIRAFPKDDPCAVMLVHDGSMDEDSEDGDASAIEISQTGQIERF